MSEGALTLARLDAVSGPEIVLENTESVPSVLESAASGEIAELYSDIRNTLGTSVVNLIWRNLATIQGALPWAWSAVRPLYLGAAAPHAEAVRRTLRLPETTKLSAKFLAASGIDGSAREEIHTILDSYHHTNALALVVLSALLERYDPSAGPAVEVDEAGAPVPVRTELPALPAMTALPRQVRLLIDELNGYGEDGAPYLIASMYRHLAYWPAYLAIIRDLLAPLQADGSLNALTRSARVLGRAHGKVLARELEPAPPPRALQDALASCRLFVEHPIARMTGICALIRGATEA